MGGILGGSSRTNNPQPPAPSLRFNTSVNGQPIPILHGQARLASNCTWYDGFLATAQSSDGDGGKGGSDGSGSTTYTYSVNVTFGICEGPIDQVLLMWKGSTPKSPSKENLTYFTGAGGQAPWAWQVSAYPEVALGYSWLAYAGANPMGLGSSPNLPNLNWEVKSAIANAVVETHTVASPYTFTPTYWSLAASVTELVTIPPAPSTVQAQNYKAKTVMPVVLGHITPTSIVGSASQGVIEDSTGIVFTRVSGSPAATGQYKVSGGGLYTFYPADAGRQVRLIDLAVSPGVRYAYLPTGNTHSSNLVDGISSMTGIVAGQLFQCPGFPAGTVVLSVSGSSVTLSNPSTSSLTAAALIFFGATLDQVLDTSPAQGKYSISVQPGTYGQYKFSTADNGAALVIVDIPDASPADSLTDFLTNPRYGCGFPSAYLGDLTQLTDYAYSLGLFISPAIVQATAANSYLRDFSTGLNGEFVWSNGKLTWVPYGDSGLSGFGHSYTAPSAPIYDLTDDDLLKNEGTSSIGVSSFTSDDPIVCVCMRQSNALNDVKVEYLDRGNSYNPAIVEAQNDAAINDYGLKAADTKSLHFFCIEAAAMMSAQLQLGRQQLRNQYGFTVPWYFILLDPMDIIAITDAALGLSNQWVRITEITENQQDMTLTITAEEYLTGSATAPIYGTQPKSGTVVNDNVDPPDCNTPIIFAAPPKIANNGALEIWVLASGAAGWGGCDVYASSDDTTYKFVGRIQGPARQGVLLANFPSGTDPDTTDTLSVDLTESEGALNPGSNSDADLAHTLCYVDGELIAYSAATLTATYQYALGTYIRRGLYGTSISAHASGAGFVRLGDTAGILTIPYSADQIGSTLYLKLTAFNLWQGGEQDVSDVAAIPFVVPAPPMPAMVTGFSAQQNGGPVAFTWTDSADPQGSLKGYDILYGPQGGTVAGATLLTEASRTTETTTVSVPPGAWTFYIRGHDIAGQLGPATAVNLTVVNSNIVTVAQANEPDWLGPSLPSFALDGGGWADDGTAPIGTATRSGATATRTNWQSAVQQAMPANWLRRDFNLLTNAPLGWLLEGARTNTLRHNDMAGAVAGTPGTNPTNWTFTSTANGLTRTIVGTGCEFGMNFIDVQFQGTSTSSANRNSWVEAASEIAATQGQNWTLSAGLRLVGGAMTGVSNFELLMQEEDNTGAQLAVDVGPSLTITAALLMTAFSHAIGQASAAFVRPAFQFGVPNGTAVNFTIRHYAPQLEYNNFASSLIQSTGAVVTRGADGWSIPVSKILNWAADRGALLLRAMTAPGIDGANQFLVHFNDGGENNCITIYRDSSRVLWCAVTTGGVSQAALNLGTVADSTAFALAFSWGPSGFFASLNGGTVASDLVGTVPSGLTTLSIGTNSAGTLAWFGHLSTFAYYGIDMAASMAAAAAGSPATQPWGFAKTYTGVLAPDTLSLASALSNAQLFEDFVPSPVAAPAYIGPTADLGFNSSVRAYFASSATPGRGVSGASALTPYMDAWLSGAPDPESFALLGPGNVTARYLRGKIVENSAVPSYLAKFDTSADAPAQTYLVNGFAVAPGGTDLVFASVSASPPLPTQFHTIPNIQVTPKSGVNVRTGVALSPSVNDATIHLYDSSQTDIAGTADVAITGV